LDNKRLFLAALLSFAVVVGWQLLFPVKPPPPPGPKPSAVETSAAPAASQAPVAAAGTAQPGTSATPQPLPAPAETTPIGAPSAEEVILETPETRARFTNRGAQLVSFQLKGHDNAAGEPLDLVRGGSDGLYPFGLAGADGKPHPLDQALFAVEEDSGGQAVTFRYRGTAGAATKRFEFQPNGTFRVRVTLPGSRDWALVLGPGLRNPSAAELKSRFERRAGVYRAADEVEVLDPQRTFEPVRLPGAGLSWAGLEDTYFLAVLVPQRIERVAFHPRLVVPDAEGKVHFEPLPPKGQMSGAQKDLSREFLVVFEPGSEELVADAYWGAKQYDRLAALPWGLAETVRWGTFGLFARALLVALQWIHAHVVANYGWAIVLLTVLIKILLLPLTHKSYVSMQKMQALNPKMQAIRERWRPKLKDRQGKPNLEAQRKMQEEMNALFKGEGVNPAGGCLPMLLQLPILFAFYNLLSTAIELRHAPWILWIRDLSAADPYYVLPIVMGATQVIQQRMTPTTADPMQRRIFQLMPIFFTVLFLGFPSGLVLYWLVNNVLTIAQQAVYNHLKRRGNGAAPAAEEPRARRGRA
jgi:YidC/Oxa1 family membrane protein insertase